MAEATKSTPRKKASKPKARAPRRTVIDPITSMLHEVQARPGPTSASILDKPPLRQWLLGLCELKIRVGTQLPWDDIVMRLMLGSQAAVEPGAQIVVDGKSRRPTADELKTLQQYAEHPVDITAMRRYLRRVHIGLWIKIRSMSNAYRDDVGSNEA